ncbi:MAG TPA: SCO family protein [Candidatus Sulfotelmatobacter sp.]|jgi:protein SCO1/2|nr:SCO family protein [Candidatus Sulfotelmatobacter sp.]
MSEKNTKPAAKTPRFLAATVAAVIVLILGLAWRMDWLAPAPAATVGGPFTLVDGNGKSVSDTDFRGKLMLIYFGYTFCPDICPTTLGTVARAFEQLDADQRKQIQPIFITVDPERDTADQMGQYVGNFMPDLIGLTGSPDQIQKVMIEFRVYARKAEQNGPNYSVDHSSVLYLIGRDGKFVRPFSGSISADDLAAALKKAL